MIMDPNLKSSLTCPICLDLYTNPVTLSCMHSFCRECLLQNFDSRIPAGKDTNTFDIPCPNCKTNISLSRHGIRSMQRNFHLDGIVDAFKNTAKKGASAPGASAAVDGPVCELCNDKEGRAATKKCLKCEISYCSECFRVHHPPSTKAFANHNVREIKSSATGARNKPTPQPRRGGSKTRSANATPTEPIKTQLRKELTELDQGADETKKAIGDLKQEKSQIERKTDDLKNSITNESRKLRDFITKTENEQRASVSDESKEKLSAIEDQLQKRQEHLHQQEDVADAIRALLKEPDDELFLRNSSSVEQRVQDVKRNKPRPASEVADTDLPQSSRMFENFRQQAQTMINGEDDIYTSQTEPSSSQPHSPPAEKTPPSRPLLHADMCVCRSDSITICITPPVFVGDVAEGAEIDQYAVKYKSPGDIDWREIVVPFAQIENTGCVKFDSLTPSSQYNFNLRAHNSSGWSSWSSIILVKTAGLIPVRLPPPPPRPPKQHSTEKAPIPGPEGAPWIDLTMTDVGAEIVILRWIDHPDMPSEAHIVAYCKADTAREDWTYIVSQSHDLSLVVRGLISGSEYLFMVSCCSKDGFSKWSEKVIIKLGQQSDKQKSSDISRSRISVKETSFRLDSQTAHPCLVITGSSITHPSNSCPSVSEFFTNDCYSTFGTATFTSGAHYWEVIIHGRGSKVRIGVAAPNVNFTKPLGTYTDSLVLVLDARAEPIRQGGYVLYGNRQYKSNGQWIPFTKSIGVLLDYSQKEISFIEYDGTKEKITRTFKFNNPPDQLKPVFAIDDKTDDLRLQVVTDKKPPAAT